ncbi:MAG: SpoIID/LytB domain-containing protein [Acidimicrobiales bacterium]
MLHNGSVLTAAPRRRRCARLVIATVVALGASILAVGVTPQPASAGGPSFVITGGGYGHGVGLSQWGTKGDADRGTQAGGILSHYYSGTSVDLLPQPEPRILLGGTSDFTAAPNVGLVRLYLAGAYGSPCYNGCEIFTRGAPDAITIVPSGSGYRVTTASGDGWTGGTSGDVMLLQLNGNQTSVSGAGLESHRYKWGNIRVSNLGGSLDAIVQQMTMRQYLYGIAEVPSSWPREALRSQVDAARTYAKSATESRRSADSNSRFDLYGSTRDQYYVGFDKEAGSGGGNWIAAVDQTGVGDSSGAVVTYGGGAIQAFYFSSSGGQTENSESVFVASLPYTRSVADPTDDTPGNPRFRWSVTLDGDQMAAAIDRSLGTVLSVNLLGPFGASGRIDKSAVDVVGTAKTVRINGAQLAGRLALPSTLVFSLGANQLPTGSLDSVNGYGSSVGVTGWAVDVDRLGQSVEIDVSVDGSYAGLSFANGSRPDVAGVYPSFGSNRGFAFNVPAAPGTHSVCVNAIDANQPGGYNTLGCRTVVVGGGNGSPVGNLEADYRSGNDAVVQGWAIDPDTTGPVEIDVLVDGTYAALQFASLARPDVGAAYPSYGPNHGFSLSVPVGGGAHQVCAWAINQGPGVTGLLGCATV